MSFSMSARHQCYNDTFRWLPTLMMSLALVTRHPRVHEVRVTSDQSEDRDCPPPTNQGPASSWQLITQNIIYVPLSNFWRNFYSSPTHASTPGTGINKSRCRISKGCLHHLHICSADCKRVEHKAHGFWNWNLTKSFTQIMKQHITKIRAAYFLTHSFLITGYISRAVCRQVLCSLQTGRISLLFHTL